MCIKVKFLANQEGAFVTLKGSLSAKGAKIDKKLSMSNVKPLLRGCPWGAPEPFQAQQNSIYRVKSLNNRQEV